MAFFFKIFLNFTIKRINKGLKLSLADGLDTENFTIKRINKGLKRKVRNILK